MYLLYNLYLEHVLDDIFGLFLDYRPAGKKLSRGEFPFLRWPKPNTKALESTIR